jgi:hypothetical protein
MKGIIFFSLMLFSSITLSAIEASGSYNVLRIDSYSEYGGGDVVVKLTTHTANCSHGYWLKKNDPGFQANFSMVLAAYQAKNKIKLIAHTDQLWPGTGGKVCHVYTVRYE